MGAGLGLLSGDPTASARETISELADLATDLETYGNVLKETNEIRDSYDPQLMAIKTGAQIGYAIYKNPEGAKKLATHVLQEAPK